MTPPLGINLGIVALSGVAASGITYSPPMTGLKLWYAADNVNSGSAQPADGDPVGTWMNLAPFNDPAGTDSNLSQSTAANQPNFIEAVPYASGSYNTAKTVPGMKWSNNNGNSVDTWMSTTGSLFGGSITGGGMNDFTRYIVVSNCWAYIDGYPNYLPSLWDNGFYNEGGSSTDSTQRNYTTIRQSGADYGYNDYGFHGQMAKTSGNKDFWWGAVNTTATPPHEFSLFNSSSINVYNQLSFISNRWQISGTQSLSVNGIQLASYDESCNERSGITGLTCGGRVSYSTATNVIQGNSGWDGYIHEVLVYTGSSEENYRQVNEYLSQKYGVANTTGSIFPHKNSLLRWWKADEGVTATGGYIDKWDDFGTSGNHAYPNISGSAFAKPQLLTSYLNGKDIVLVGSASGELQSFFEYTSSDSPGPEDPHTMIALYQPQTLTAAVHKPKNGFPVSPSSYQASPLIMETNTDDQLLSLNVGGHYTFGTRIGGGMVRVSGSIYGYLNALDSLQFVQEDEWQLFAMTNAAQGDYSFYNTGSDFNTGNLPRAVQLRWQTDPFDGNSSGLPFPANASNNKYRHNGYNNTTTHAFVSADFKAGGATWPSASSGAGVAKGRIGRAIWDEYNTTSWNTHCKVAEIMVFQKALTRQEIQQVAMYLQQKWGINLG